MWNKLTVPSIVFDFPYNHASESFLRWWHINVKNCGRDGRWFAARDAEECLVKLEFARTDGSSPVRVVQGMWDTPNGPVERKTLIADESLNPVSIVLRSSEHCIRYGISINPGTVYITGLQFLSQKNGMEQLSLGDYLVRIIVRSRSIQWRSRDLYLEIRGEGLNGCVVSVW